MRGRYQVLTLALGIAVALGMGVANAGPQAKSGGTAGTEKQSDMQHQQGAMKGAMNEEMKGHGMGHSHEQCELHGGKVTMTQGHHFETLFAPDGIRIFMYSANQNPLIMDEVTGTVAVEDGSGKGVEMKLVPIVLKEGEPTVYFCTMNDTPPQMKPGKCPKCGMALVPQMGLFAPMDLSTAKPGSVKAVVHLTGLQGKEKDVTFTEVNLPDEDEAKTPMPSAPPADKMGSPSRGQTSDSPKSEGK